MNTNKPGVIGTVGVEAGELVLRLYSVEDRELIAIVIGSEPYIEHALSAAGLPAPISFPKYRDRRQRALARCQPANGNAKSSSEQNERASADTVNALALL